MKIRKGAIIISLLVFFNTFNIAAYAQSPVVDNIIASIEIETRAANIDWVYKPENGKIYRRLYDFTNQKWIGDWVLCP